MVVQFNKAKLEENVEQRQRNRIEEVFKDSDERPCFFIEVFKRNSSAPIALPKRGDVRGAVSSQLKPAVLCVTQKRVPGEKNDSAATAQWAPEACLYYLRANGASDSEPFRVHKSWPVRSLVRMEVTKLASADPAPFFLELTFQGADKEGGDSSTLFASANESVQTNIACFLHFYCQEYEKRPVPIFGMETEAQEAWLTENRSMIEAAGNLEAKADSDIRKETGGVLMGQREEADLEELSKSYAVNTADMDSLAEMAQRELQALEFANVHSILEGNEQVSGLLQKMTMTFGSLDDLEGWLSVFNDKLVHMREDIHAIEETNLRLERQAQNHQRLVDLLKSLMGQIQVSEEAEEALMEGELDEPGPDLDRVVTAVRELHEALSRIDPLRARRAKRALETGRGDSDDESEGEDVSMMGSEDGEEGEGGKEEGKEEGTTSAAAPPSALPSVPREILHLDAVVEMRQELEDLEDHFLERFSDSILDLIKSECQDVARRAQAGDGIPRLAPLHDALAPYRPLFEAVKTLRPHTWNTLAVSYGKVVGGMLRTCMKIACQKLTGGQDLATFFARVAKGARPDARGRPPLPLPSSGASVVSAGAYSARSKLSLGSGGTFSSFIDDAEHLPPLDEGAAEERPDRLIVLLVENFVPILLEEVVFIADGLLLARAPLPKNFDPLEHEVGLTAAGARAVAVLLKGVADDLMNAASGVIKAKKILTASALAVTYFWREVCVRNVGAGPHVRGVLDALAKFFESSLTADIQERVLTITKFAGPKGSSQGLKATHVLPFTARLGPFLAAIEQVMAELRRNCKIWAKELRKKRSTEYAARAKVVAAEERARHKQEAARERAEEAGRTTHRHGGRRLSRPPSESSRDDDNDDDRSDVDSLDSARRPRLSEGSMSLMGDDDADDGDDASSLGRGLSDEEDDEEHEGGGLAPEPPIIFELSANAEFVSDLQAKSLFGRGALWTPNMVRTISALIGEEEGCTLEWTLVNAAAADPAAAAAAAPPQAELTRGTSLRFPGRSLSLGGAAGDEDALLHPFEGLERTAVLAVRRVLRDVHVRIVYAIVCTVEKVAVTDVKRGDRLRLENYGLMAEQLGTLAGGVPYIAAVLESVGRAADLAMGRYVRSLLKRGGFWELLEMVTWIDLLRDDLGADEVRHQLNFSLPEVRKAVKVAMTGLDKRLKEVLAKIVEHVGSNGALVQRTWAAFSDALVTTYERLARQLEACYGETSLQPPVGDLEAVLAGLMQQLQAR